MAIKINGSTVISDTQAITSTSTISATGNITAGNVVTAGTISATTIVANVTPPAGGVISTTGNVTGGNLLTGGIVSATGNITGSYIIGNGSQLTGLPAGYTNANLASLGSNVISTSGNVTSGNFLTGGLISATGNITGGNINVGNITIATDLISSLGATITIDPATAGNAGHVVINGNLQVNGTTTTINSNVVSTNDLTVNYANNAINSSAANGGGIEVGPIGTPYITWLYNSTANVFTSSGGISAVGNITGGNISATNHTGTAVSVTGNITGGNVLTGGLISATGAIQVGGDISLVGNIVDTGPLTIITSSNGNITLSPNGTGVVVINKDLVNGQANGVGNIGSSTGYFNTVFAKATSAQYADLAELYTADAEYEPGTVVEFGGAAEVTLSSKAGSTRVAGVVSTNPSYIMNSTLQSEHVAVVALQGRVPCKVIGPVSKGDMMVAAGGGYAKVDNNAKAGTIIGKALEVLHNPHGIIEVVVGRN